MHDDRHANMKIIIAVHNFQKRLPRILILMSTPRLSGVKNSKEIISET